MRALELQHAALERPRRQGEKLKQLSELLHGKNDKGDFSPDFSLEMSDFYGAYGERKNAQGKAYYDAMNVMRADKEGRQRATALNYSFFNAPQAAFLFMPSFGDNVRVAGDIGMYGQTFLLSLAARGLGGIPQTALGFFAGTIREFLGIPDELKMLFGISFGYPARRAPGSRIGSSATAVSWRYAATAFCGKGRLKKYPCMREHPCAWRRAACPACSTPSATTLIPRLLAMPVIARTIARHDASWGRLRTND